MSGMTAKRAELIEIIENAILKEFEAELSYIARVKFASARQDETIMLKRAEAMAKDIAISVANDLQDYYKDQLVIIDDSNGGGGDNSTVLH